MLLKQEKPELFDSVEYGTLDNEMSYHNGYYIWPKVYCLAEEGKIKARIKGVSMNSMVVDENIV